LGKTDICFHYCILFLYCQVPFVTFSAKLLFPEMMPVSGEAPQEVCVFWVVLPPCAQMAAALTVRAAPQLRA
jgi:hypothetical protein